jgi:lantibiotic biosynthesis protein
MNADTGHWRPILTGADADRVFSLLDSIAVSLTDQLDRTVLRPELSTGGPGVAMFFAYLCKVRRTTRWLPVAARALHAALDGAFDDEYRHGFLDGRAGIIWTAHHLLPDVEIPDLQQMTQDIEDLILARFATPRHEYLDLFRGLVGFVRYGLDRLDDAQGRCIAREGVERLLQRAEPLDGGVAWWTELDTQKYSKAQRHIRLNLAHGVPSVIAVLAAASKLGVAPEPTRSVLDQAVGWLLAQRNPEHVTSRFGTAIMPEPDGIDRSTARLAWCWGDLGISLALYGAALNLGGCWWGDDALALARHAARRPMADAGVLEAGLCHGATGAGHLFNRLYQNTREEIFLAASRRWFSRAFEYEAGPEEVPIRTHKSEEMYRPWPNKPGLLLGLAGIGLALLAAVSDVEPKWDKALLIDIPAGPTV